MVSYRSGRQGETLAEHTIRWPRKPRTQQERIEEWLGSSDLHELLAAAEALEKQEPEASSLLRSIVHHDAQKCSAEKKQLRLGVTLTVLVSLAILCWYAASPGIAGSAAACLLMGVWMASPCTLSWYKNYKTHARRLSHAVALLHRIPLPATAAEMIEALDAGDSRTASLAARSLIQLLPQFTESEGALLQTQHHTALRHALGGYDSDLILAILQASDHILDHAAIPHVLRLTQCPDWIAESEQIQAAAHRSLSALKQESERSESGLAASANDADAAAGLAAPHSACGGAASSGDGCSSTRCRSERDAARRQCPAILFGSGPNRLDFQAVCSTRNRMLPRTPR